MVSMETILGHPMPDPSPPISPLKAHVGFWLRFVSNHVSGRFRRLLEAEGISVSQWVVLRELHEAPGCGPAELMLALGMTKGAVSKILAGLEGQGLLLRKPQQGDRRAQSLALTPGAKALLPRLAELADANDAHFFGHLSAEAQGELIAAMQGIVARHQMHQVPTE